MKRFLFLVSALAIVLVGLGFIMPAIAEWRLQGNLPGISSLLLLLGLSLVGGGVTLGIRLLRSRSN